MVGFIESNFFQCGEVYENASYCFGTSILSCDSAISIPLRSGMVCTH